jgi:hypothetical protein
MKIVLSFLLLIIPLVWCRYVNGNYLSTKTFLFYFASSLSLLALPNKLELRNIPKSLLFSLPFLLLYYLLHSFSGGKYSEFLSVFKMLGFCFISFFIYSLSTNISDILRRLSLHFCAFWTFVLGIGLWQVFDYRFLKSEDGVYMILGTFGNVNMFAEFLVLTLPFLFFWLRLKNDITPYFLKLICFTASIYLLVYTGSRSAWLGAIIWALIFAVRDFKKNEWISVGIAIISALITFHSAPTIEKLKGDKNLSVGVRSSLYSASIRLMVDHPFGIRPGQFMNEIVPYLMSEDVGPHEFTYFDQPHSEPLKWGVQQGIPFMILGVSILLFIFYLMTNEYLKSDRLPKTEASFFLGSLVASSPQIIFQFPFENPASSLHLAFLFGLWLSKFPVSGKHINLKWSFPLIGLISFLGIVNSFLFAFSIILESHYVNSPDIMNIVCKAYPVNFRACYAKNRSLFDQKNINSFRREFKEDFSNNPFYCDNLRLLPEFFNYANSEKKTCESIYLYAQIFKNQTTYKIESMPVCQRYSSPVLFKDSKQFNQDFRKWFLESK